MDRNSPQPPLPEPPKLPEAPEEPRPKLLPRPSLAGRLRNYFLAGVIVLAPVSITFWIVWQVIELVDSLFKSVLPPAYHPERWLPFSIPGLGAVLMVGLITLIGMLTAGYVGRSIMRVGEAILNRMPVIRNIYGALKQIFVTVFSEHSQSFREVVLLEYPRRGTWAIGFVTGTTRGEIQDRVEPRLINVFVPTTPNPTSGFLLFVPREDVLKLEMSVEEGVKMVISGGIVVPERLQQAAAAALSGQPATRPPATVD
ncbi:MAG: DUF502 domain-containing protein [Geminicoccaceae bacterium]|nr:MAG: DUF502 domain-containing protein [Geminicoccaceae bacterium]